MARGSTSVDTVQLSASFLTLGESISLKKNHMQLSFVLIFRHTNIYTYTYMYMHTPIHTCRDVDLSVKQKDSFILLKDLCLTCFFFVCYFPSFLQTEFLKTQLCWQLLSAQWCERLTTLVSKRKLDLQFFSYLFYWISFPKVYISTFYQDICILNLLYTSAVGFLLEICKKSAKEEKKEAI